MGVREEQASRRVANIQFARGMNRYIREHGSMIFRAGGVSMYTSEQVTVGGNGYPVLDDWSNLDFIELQDVRDGTSLHVFRSKCFTFHKDFSEKDCSSC